MGEIFLPDDSRNVAYSLCRFLFSYAWWTIGVIFGLFLAITEVELIRIIMRIDGYITCFSWDFACFAIVSVLGGSLNNVIIAVGNFFYS